MGKGKTVRTKAGPKARMLGINMDITERKAADIQAAQHREQLRHLTRVAVLGELSGALAHELNQPLTAILSNAQAAQQLLREGSMDVGEVLDILKDIEHDDMRAAEVIKRLRAMLKNGEIRREPVHLNEIVQDVLEFLHSKLLTENVAVATHIHEDTPHVRGDRVQLQQVLLNLVMNACEAMTATPRSGRRLSIYSACDTAGMLRISVADCGVGIKQGEFEALFEPFFTTKDQGLGLGLSISRSLITAHGGRLWGERNGEGGATFHFSLPVHHHAAG